MNDDPSPAPAGVLSPPAAVFLLLLFFLIGALFALSESAVNTTGESRVKKDKESGDPRAARFLDYLTQSETFASPLQFGMMLVGFFAVGVSVVAFVPLLDDVFHHIFGIPLLPAALLSTLLLILVCSLLFLTLADFLPKKLTQLVITKDPARSYRLVGLIRCLAGSMRPVMAFCDLISNGLLRLLGHDPKDLAEIVTEEEILHMVGEGEEHGVIEEDERDIIENVFDFNDTDIGEVMTHRTEICAVSEGSDISEVAAVAVEEGFSRILVYGEDIDDVRGILYVKDLLPYIGAPIPETVQLPALLRPAYFVPESKKCSQLFKELKAKRIQIAVVVDEYGGTAGLITLEDLVESIFGSIQDEFDDEEEAVLQVSDDEMAVSGTTPVDEISELTGVSLPEGDYDTIGGLVTELLGYLPKESEHPTVTVKGLSITVLQVEDQRLERLLISKSPGAEPAAEKEA